MDSLIVNVLTKNQDVLLKKWLIELEKTDITGHVKFAATPNMLRDTNEEFFRLLLKHISYNDISQDGSIERFFDQLLQTGLPVNYMTQGLQGMRRVILDVLLDDGSIDKEKAIELYNDIDRWLDPILNRVVENSAQIWEKTISIQKSALLELTAPLIPVFQQVSVMPLIGTIDTERAKLIMENLLDGVIKYRSEVVLIDITGVPVVDTMVAHHIIQAADAVRLLGSTCILVGIRPEIAQTIVSLGIDLTAFPTKSTLQKGMERALEITSQEIVRKED
ncbi:STAS domain-containing protein [Fictibacillus aquaticus]|uniref:RsbT co-antagonist protein RsbRA n=1 Tax=Fictibacillus aquaticus TaxID=2021314 RepID=A0A235F4T9_9BACL|nr:STAS domain-containing protein [Fictibacillus aquaticus]OYD56270.1 RsbT co-antagonist protein RsbRA [Fictibacillus aquaticus]